jgi:hypothetical protein
MEIKYTEHLELRLELRGFPYDLPKDICEGAEEYYYDTSTSNYVALKRLTYAGKRRTMAVTYSRHEDVVEIITIHPIKEGQKEKRIRSGRWVGV